MARNLEEGEILIEKESIVALVAILLFSSTALPQGRGQRGGGQRGAAQESASATAALPFSPRDLSGIWLGRNRVLAVSEDPPPRTPWGDAKFNSYKPSYGPRAIRPALRIPSNLDGRARATPGSGPTVDGILRRQVGWRRARRELGRF